MLREATVAALLLAGCLFVVIGVAQWSHAAAWIVGGVLLAGWALVAVRDVDQPTAP